MKFPKIKKQDSKREMPTRQVGHGEGSTLITMNRFFFVVEKTFSNFALKTMYKKDKIIA
jgi:hypothetical protein